ncbi:hypothetical protein UCRNP2_2437 [Neofusicoccum parvum UCRNP2]|uniref:Uncharacterized protein n=1 Tax=Botryosphaeria parva (strain UCR-NP2) TaxID=1287680 RepID=R1ET09_BOTPV|nr:hypothetical protein UCRNP2_2437 [Neofusicoccum parvum UCRNP2]
MEMTCCAAAINDTATGTCCTVEAQHCYNQEFCWGTLEGDYTCTDALQTYLGGTITEHCARQKEICDARAVQEHLCRTGPHYKN